jgi:hypothetical protein
MMTVTRYKDDGTTNKPDLPGRSGPGTHVYVGGFG